jgi:hypothetical protein
MRVSTDGTFMNMADQSEGVAEHMGFGGLENPLRLSPSSGARIIRKVRNVMGEVKI